MLGKRFTRLRRLRNKIAIEALRSEHLLMMVHRLWASFPPWLGSHGSVASSPKAEEYTNVIKEGEGETEETAQST